MSIPRIDGCVYIAGCASVLLAQSGIPVDGAFDVIVGDLSFISQTLVLPAAVPLLKPGGALLMLVKPQFELQPADIGEGGIVRDEAAFERVEPRIRQACASTCLEVTDWFESAIAGGDGNREFFVRARRRGGAQETDHG